MLTKSARLGALFGVITAATSILATACAVHAETPMSAIDWLSESVNEPNAVINKEEAVSDGAGIESITIESLDAVSPDSLGVLSPEMSGLPFDLWANSESTDIATAIGKSPDRALPAIASLRRRLLLAEADKPAGSDGSLLLARVDKLLDLGALEDAQALLDLTDSKTPDLFRRWFDVALLTGTEDRACDVLRNDTGIAPTYQARIFCLARNGDWNAAALTLNSAERLGVISAGEYDLISRFLDPDLYEGEAALPIPDRPTPLVFRMYEAIGEPLATSTLPRAFAHADLRKTAGWKARIEAAERLARVGAISEIRLLDIYSERRPAASGGVWDRVSKLQKFDHALAAGDVDAVADTLPDAWRRMSRAELSRPFAMLYADRLSELPLSGVSAAAAYEIALMSDDYERARLRTPTDASNEAFLGALAQGNPDKAAPGDEPARAILDGFDGSPPPADLTAMLDAGQLGEAILRSIELFEVGANGDLEQLTRALRFFRAVGLEDTARQAGLQVLLMDRRS